MKKITVLIIVLALTFAVSPSVFASSLPFTDEDYAREDFCHDDYEKYVVDSIDINGCDWPEGTKAISWEIPTGHKNIVRYKTVKVPRDIEIIGDCCFMDRDGITDEVIDFKTLTELKCIGKNAFRDTHLKRVDLSNTKVVRIDEHAFYSNHISVFIAPSTLKYIGSFAFGKECSIEFIELNEGLEYIGDHAFWQYKGKLVIPSTVKFIGYSAMPTASVYVHKGSYAEQWCNDNGMRYHYVNEESDSNEDSEKPHIKHRVGPLNIEGYYTHFVSERTFGDGTKVLCYQVNATPGAVLETAVDGVEVYYAPAFRIDGEYINKAALADKTEFEGFRGGKAGLYEYGVDVLPTQRLEKGWKKGVRWTLNKPKNSSIPEHALVVEYDGTTYRYIVSLAWADHYKTARENQNYNKKGLDNGSSAKSGTSKIIVDGKELSAESYNIFGNNYFRLRDIAMFLTDSQKQFEVTYDDEKRAINLVTGKAYTPVGGELKTGDGQTRLSFSACPSPVYCDGKEMLMRARLIDGTNYIMLRDLGKIINFEILWDDVQKCIIINTQSPYAED